MSWFNECTLSYEEFEKIRLYLLLFKTLIEITKPNIFNSELLEELIDKLESWLQKE